MAEKIVLIDPIVRPQIVTTEFSLASLYFQILPAPLLMVRLVGTNGEQKEISYGGEAGIALLRAFNTADLSQESMVARILRRLVVDGHFVGNVEVTP